MRWRRLRQRKRPPINCKPQNKSLQDQLAAAQTDKGATLYAIVIVVIGALLAFAVFFGLRRSGK